MSVVRWDEVCSYPEYLALFYAARVLGRPVKWTDERSESFVSDSHGRDHDMTAELALDAEGNSSRAGDRLRRSRRLCRTRRRLPATANAVKNTIGVYSTPLMEVSTRIVVHQYAAGRAYRGAGRPEGNYYMERLVDTAAAELGIDKIELRRRNHIPEMAMPYKAPNGTTYDSGEFTAVLDQALAQADWDGFAARKEESRRARHVARPRRRRISGGDRTARHEMGGIRFEPDGNVTIITGTLDYGQGIATPFAQILHQRSACRSNASACSRATATSLSPAAAPAARIADGERDRHRRRQRNGHRAGPENRRACARSRGRRCRILTRPLSRSPAPTGLSTSWSWRRCIRRGLELPPALPQPSMCSISTKPAVGFSEWLPYRRGRDRSRNRGRRGRQYSMVNDFGVIVNPLLVAGQAHGGVVQGIGQALMERSVSPRTASS